MIMAWHKPPQGSLPCYSFGGMFRDSQDVVVARKVAGACGQSYQVIPVAADFLSKFSQYAERTVHLTDGCVSVNHSPDLYVNERAAEIAPVRMTGNYGGEVLRQIRAFKPVQPVSDLFCSEFLSEITAATKTYDGLLQGHPLSFAVFRQAPWHHYGLQALEQTQLSLRSPYLDNDFVRTVFRAPRSTTDNSEISRRLIMDGDARLAQIRTDRTPISGQNGWRTRALQTFLEFTVKAEYAYDYGMPRWAARVDHLLLPLHPERLFLGRHKFYHFRVWYRDQLSAYIHEMLLDSRTLSRPYLQRVALEKMVREHTKGIRNHTLGIHSVLTLELIHRLFIDS
jgi:asparagine synthase (glutamine-hydrolysing)